MERMLIVLTAILAGVIGRVFIQQMNYDIDLDSGRFSCNFCPSGTYWGGDCTPPNPRSVCHDCPPGHFQTFSNKADSCAMCRPSCPFGRQIVKANCTAVSDLQCECGKGYHWDQFPGLCLRHHSCDPGYGVISNGTPYQNTECRMCQAGKNFSPNATLTQICQPCTECPQELIQTEKCTITKDTICGKIPPDGEGWSTCTILGVVFGILGGVLALIILLIFFDSCLEAVDSEQSQRLHRNGTTRRPSSDSNHTANDSRNVKLPPSNGVGGQTETNARTPPTRYIISGPTNNWKWHAGDQRSKYK